MASAPILRRISLIPPQEPLQQPATLQTLPFLGFPPPQIAPLSLRPVHLGSQDNNSMTVEGAQNMTAGYGSPDFNFMARKRLGEK